MTYGTLARNPMITGGCQMCGSEVQVHWRHCMTCGARIAWGHEPSGRGMCTCGMIRCQYLVARLSAKLDHHLKLTQSEGDFLK